MKNIQPTTTTNQPAKVEKHLPKIEVVVLTNKLKDSKKKEDMKKEDVKKTPAAYGIVEPDLLVFFSEAFSLRQLINYLSMTSFRGNFIFKLEGIYYQQDTGQAMGKYRNTQNILNQFFLKKEYFPTYVLNTKLNNKDCEGLIFGINLGDFQKVTQQIGRNDGFNFFVLPSKSSNIYTQLIPASRQTLGRGQINKVEYIVIPEISPIDVPEFKMSEDNPNCTIPLVSFSKTFAGFQRQKCDYVKIRCFARGVIFEGYFSRSDEAMVIDAIGITDEKQKLSDDQIKLLTDVNQNDDEEGNEEAPNTSEMTVSLPNIEGKEIAQVKVSSSVVRALSRWQSIGPPRGVMRLYAERGNPVIKMVCPVGSYGFLTAYLRDGGKEAEKNEVKRGRKPKNSGT